MYKVIADNLVVGAGLVCGVRRSLRGVIADYMDVVLD